MADSAAVKNTSFGEAYPDFWKAIKNNESGYFEDNENIFCFASIYPLDGYHAIRWILVEAVPVSDLSVFNNEANQRIITISTLLSFVFMFVSLVAAWLLMLKREASKREKLTENIFKNSKEGIVIMDAETRIIYVNPAFSKITGYSEDEALGRKPSDLKKGDKRLELLYKMIKNAVNDTGSWQGEIIEKRKDGSTYPRMMTISKVFDSRTHELVNYLEIFEDLTSTRMIEETIDKMKNYDEITGLPTQVLFEQQMKGLIRKYDHIAVMILQITNYESLFHNLGKTFGTALIKEATARIKTFLNDEDLIGKLNRDQFVIARINGSEKLKLDSFLSKLLSFLQESIDIENKKNYLNISIGMAIFPDHSADIEKLISFANIAKNYAIQTGDNTYVYYEKEIEHNYWRNLKLETELRSALKKNELSLNFQPQVETGTGEIIGTEALLRWNNGELGRVGPDQFIPLAEKMELIIPIGKWVLEEAIKQNKKWMGLTKRRLVVAVNLSPVQFKNENLHELIQQLLEKYQMPAELLEVEVTEGVLVNNLECIKNELDKIEALGVKVSIDDFGTGYSSLKYLQRLKFDKLKIDREFIKDYPETDNGNIAKMIITLANQIGLKVLAEGVETKEQFMFLKENRCDEIQGYYFYKPMTADDFEKVMADKKN